MELKQSVLLPLFDDNQKDEAEEQILDRQKEIDYDIREYPVEVVVSKFVDKLENDKSELFIPDYQREMVWSEKQQARFIESILLNLPIPYIYVSDVVEGEDEGRLEIVDGSQRVRTLVNFLSSQLRLNELSVLNKLNGFTFKDLPLSRQLRFKRKTLRTIELLNVDEEARRQLFDRLNTGGTRLREMEQRFGSKDGPFINFIKDMAALELFRELCPVSPTREKYREYEELVLRFFAYSDRYQSFKKRVDKFLDEYMDEKNRGFDEAVMRSELVGVLEFVKKHFPYGFKKNEKNKSVPRIRFEAIAVGINLALRIDPNVDPENVSWIDSKEFSALTRSDASNSLPRVISRINYVRDNILGVYQRSDDNGI